MKLNEIYAKDVARPIDGVIDADSATHLEAEVEEYVLTNEVAAGLLEVLQAYTGKASEGNGVWISGFFGSGKSHLLKMTAHLLGDVDGQRYERAAVSSSFRNKTTDAFLLAELNKAASIPAKSLLFDIGKKAILIAKDPGDAILRAFVKVFDESRGYYGKQGYIARLESHLDRAGQYGVFKDAFKRNSGTDWAQGRDLALIHVTHIEKAWAEATGSSSTDILAKFQREYSVSVEDFAKEVSAWLDTQDPSFRLNFFVDEAGAFIGMDTQRMLSLQGIAESLKAECGGRAWIMVTSQEDMDKVVGDRTKQQGNDFSRIQARFATRVKLSSTDVEQVIQKRLLEKNAAGEAELKKIYAEESSNFKTLFDFVDGRRIYRNHADEEHFVGTHPFVSYQFPLFHAALVGLSDHNIFSGRNHAVGERSILSVVQHVAKGLQGADVRSLVTFDLLFDGISASFNDAAMKAVEFAKSNLDNPYALKILKALFLVKYVEGFEATPRNITVLMQDRFGLDVHDLSNRVKEGLAILEAQSYVQRTGNVFEYLTSAERDIEAEIKNVELDASELSKRLVKIITEEVIKTPKIRYAKNGQDFPFGFKFDDQAHGIQRDLTLHVFSPAFDNSLSDIRMQSAGRDELRVVMAADARLLPDLRLLLKTEKYTRLKRMRALGAAEEGILSSKAAFNLEREKELVERVKKAIGSSTLIVNATDVVSTSQDPLVRVNAGFQELVGRTYSQLSLLGGVTFTEQQISKYANPDQSTLPDIDPAFSKLAIAADELLAFVRGQEKLGASVTVKSIVERFETKPYGWSLTAIQVCIAHLMGTSRVAIALDGTAVKRTEAASVLRNTVKHAQEIVTVQKQYDELEVAAFRAFATSFFDDALMPKVPLELARRASEKLSLLQRELSAMPAASTYPFVRELQAPLALISEVSGRADEWYLEGFGAYADQLLEAKENIIDPIRTFFAGQQKVIYDKATALLTANNNNLALIGNACDADVKGILDHEQAFKGNRIQQLKIATSALEQLLAASIGGARTEGLATIESRLTGLKANADYAEASSEAQRRVVDIIEDKRLSLEQESQIALIQQSVYSFEVDTYPILVDILRESIPSDTPDAGEEEEADEATPGDRVNEGNDDKQGNDAEITNKKVYPKTVSIRTIIVTMSQDVLDNQADVDAYIDAYRVKLLTAIGEGKRISL